ncbi:hypothetical protein GGS23DRAFT_610538 [Durotheca rogersii]|uniref:uncharacterized protein n=1 Tax=Durotheca rogersii TaxID=419775 RepID=UPI00221FCC32|nr:uncharacterized protein GGS23DRAFT_610538 [Durotheca rogersii]KAI5862359.1 hypothetical protein GGS23DRAFT_610538 [Durotheca rogersii]
MAISWGTIKSLLIFFAPILLPKALSYYRAVRAASASARGSRPRALPAAARRGVVLLALAAGVFLVLGLVPALAPENVFARTQSRLQIPTDVLFNRLAALRRDAGAPGLAPDDEALRARFVSLESRLLYLRFGPDALARCPFCGPDDPRAYFYYAVPALLAPHLVNLVLVSLATSASFFSLFSSSSSSPSPPSFKPVDSGPGPTAGEGKAAGDTDDDDDDDDDGSGASVWRGRAALVAALLAALDLYLAGTYNHQANARATRLADLAPFFWRQRTLRLVSLAGFDAALAALVWLSGTRRLPAALLLPRGSGAVATAKAAARAARRLQAARGRLAAVGVVRNASARDEALRQRAAAYWAHEVRLMREVMEDRDVVEGVNDALRNRVDIQRVTRDADAYVAGVLPRLESEVAAAAAASTTAEESGAVPETVVG